MTDPRASRRPRAWRVAVSVAAKDLRQRTRDRSAVIIAVVAPVVLAVIISAALGGTFQEDFHTTLAVADEDGGPVASGFVDGVLASERVREIASVRPAATARSAAALVEDGDVDAAVVIPAGFSDAVVTGRAATLRVISSGDGSVHEGIATALVDGFAARVNEARLAVAVAADAGVPAPDLDAIAAAEPLAEIRVAAPEGDDLDPASYFGPAMALFFLYFAVGIGIRSVLVERDQGTLARLLAAPVATRAVLAGKALTALTIGLVSVLVVLAVSALLLGASWGDPAGALALVVAMVLAATAIVWLITAVARTEQQAGAYSALAGIGLSLLGGNFFPVTEAPEAMRRLSLLTPNGHALRGFADLAVEPDAGLGTVGGEILAIGAFAVVVGAVALAASRRLVAR